MHNLKLCTHEKYKTLKELLSNKVVKKGEISNMNNMEQMGTCFWSNKKGVEMGLQVGRSYVFIGLVQEYDGRGVNTLESKMRINVKFITGEGKSDLLKYLDGRCMEANRKAKLGMFLGGFCALSHIVIKKSSFIDNIKELSLSFS